MSVGNLNSCPVCGDGSDSALAAMVEYSVYVPEATVCWMCAEKIANAFYKKHSGEWLTWQGRQQAPKGKKESIARSLRARIFERDKYRCLRCDTHLDLCVDHVVPESLGGFLDEHNLQTLCRSCNSWKATKTIDFRGGA